MIIRDSFIRFTKRGARVIHGRSESKYMVKLEGSTAKYRVYEDWTQLDKRGSEDPKNWAPVPLVILVKGEKFTLTDDQRAQVIALAETP